MVERLTLSIDKAMRSRNAALVHPPIYGPEALANVFCSIPARALTALICAAVSKSALREKREGDVDGRHPAARLPGAGRQASCDRERGGNRPVNLPSLRRTGPVRLLYDELEAREIKSKSWTSASGRCVGGKPFSRGALYHVLQNHLYRGEIVHKGQAHPGEHAPIIDQTLWDAVQAQLATNTAERNPGTRTRLPSPLAGMLFDGDGNRMTPTHATKKGTRYRYYVSRTLITNDQTDRSTALRIPARELEQAVTSRLRQWLIDPGSVYQAIRPADPSAQRQLIARAEEIGRSWSELPAARQRACLTTLIKRIDVGANRVDIHLRPTWLGTLLDIPVMPSGADDETQILSVSIELCRSGREIKMLIERTDPFATAKPGARLIKLLIRARRFNAALVDGDAVPFPALAKRECVSPSYFTRLVRLSYLAPDITQAILDGRQPRDLTADKLLAHSRLPLSWHEQRRVLGLA